MADFEEIRSYLRSISFFEGMQETHVDLVSGCGKFVRFKAGEFLMREGEKAEKFFFIREGEVAIEGYAPAQGSKTIMTVKSGGVIGYSWLFEPHRVSFDVRAMTDIVAIKMDGVCLRSKAESDHELGYHLMKRIAHVVLQRLQATRRQLQDVYEIMERKS